MSLHVILLFVTVTSSTPDMIVLNPGDAPGPGSHSQFPVCVGLGAMQWAVVPLNPPVPGEETQRPNSGNAADAVLAASAPPPHVPRRHSDTMLKRLILTLPFPLGLTLPARAGPTEMSARLMCSGAATERPPIPICPAALYFSLISSGSAL